MKAGTFLCGCLLGMVSPFAFTHCLFSLITSWAGSSRQELTGCCFSAPEAIVDSECWRETLLKPLCHQVVAIVINEAHCVYKWSKDFRPHIHGFMSSGH